MHLLSSSTRYLSVCFSADTSYWENRDKLDPDEMRRDQSPCDSQYWEKKISLKLEYCWISHKPLWIKCKFTSHWLILMSAATVDFALGKKRKKKTGRKKKLVEHYDWTVFDAETWIIDKNIDLNYIKVLLKKKKNV